MAARSEKILEVDGREVRLLFNNRALAETEEAIGTPISAWKEDSFGVMQIAYLLRAGMEGARRASRNGKRPVTVNDAFAVLDEVGFTPVTIVVMEAVAEVLGYGANAEADADDDDGEDDERPM